MPRSARRCCSPPPATSAGPWFAFSRAICTPIVTAQTRPLRSGNRVGRRHAGVQPRVQQVCALVGQEGVLPLLARYRNWTYSQLVGWYSRRDRRRGCPGRRVQRQARPSSCTCRRRPGLPYWVAGTGSALRLPRLVVARMPYGGIRLSLTTVLFSTKWKVSWSVPGRLRRQLAQRVGRLHRSRGRSSERHRRRSTPAPSSWLAHSCVMP